MRKTLLVAGAALMLAAGPAMAQQKTIKIGFVSTYSGPTAVTALEPAGYWTP